MSGLSATNSNELVGVRDPSLTTVQRKMIRIWAYLGLEVFKDMKKDHKYLSETENELLIQLRMRIIENRMSTVVDRDAITVAVNKLEECRNVIESLEDTLEKHWLFLFRLPANFERIQTDGSDFLMRLLEADPQRGLEVGPIAMISTDDSPE